MSKIVEQFRKIHPRSEEMAEKGRKLIPGGFSHEIRAVFPFPLYIEKAEGPLKWDIDGNEYIDFVLGHGSLILGNNHPTIIKSVNETLEKGTHYGGEIPEALEWAEKVTKLIPSGKRVKFTSSGTEATMLALKLARAFSGKEKMVMFHYHFHGWNDMVTTSGAGIPPLVKKDRYLLSVHDLEGLETVLKLEEIGGVILEPTGASWGLIPISKEHLQKIRNLTQKYGAVLIFDEVVTGFRISPSGAQGWRGVFPDLTCLAKCLVGGFPGGAVAGEKQIMELLEVKADSHWNEERRVSHPGTFNANPVSAAAGSAALELLSSGEEQWKAEEMAQRFKNGLNHIIKERGIAGCVYGDPTIFKLLLGASCPKSGQCISSSCIIQEGDLQKTTSRITGRGLKRGNLLKLALFNRGVDIMAAEGGFLSSTHSRQEIDRALEAFEGALGDLQYEGLL